MLPSVLTTVLFSLSVIFGNRSAQILGGISANFWRLILATIFLGIYAHWLGGGISGDAFFLFIVSGCVGFGIGDIALFQALPVLGSRLTILLVQCLAAPFAVATEWIWLDSVLSVQQMVASSIILVGVAMALFPDESSSSKQIRAIDLRGVVYAVIAAFGQGFGAVISRKAFAVAASAGQSIDGITAAYQRILGGLAVGLLFYAFCWLKNQRQERDMSSQNSKSYTNIWQLIKTASPWVLLNSLAGPSIGVSCYQWALKTTPAGIVLPIVATSPLVILPFAHYFENDRPHARAWIGGFIAVVGAVLLSMFV